MSAEREKYSPLRANLPVRVTTGIGLLWLGGCALLEKTPNPGEVVYANPVVGVNPLTKEPQLLGYEKPPVNGTRALSYSVVPNKEGPPDVVITGGDTGADRFAKPVTAVGTLVGPFAQIPAAALSGGTGTSIVVGGATANAVGRLNKTTVPVRTQQTGPNDSAVIQLAP